VGCHWVTSTGELEVSYIYIELRINVIYYADLPSREVASTRSTRARAAGDTSESADRWRKAGRGRRRIPVRMQFGGSGGNSRTVLSRAPVVPIYPALTCDFDRDRRCDDQGVDTGGAGAASDGAAGLANSESGISGFNSILSMTSFCVRSVAELPESI
jgi:hypothetical protein